MNRRRFLERSGLLLLGGAGLLGGCRGHQHAQVLTDHQKDLVGTHAAGAETFKPLVEEAVCKLLGRQTHGIQQVGATEPAQPKRICFVCVENKSSEELGDFKEQLTEIIDNRIVESSVFQPISRRYVQAALRETRLRPDELCMPAKQRLFQAALEQQGQPFDYLLYATLTSGTTRSNDDFQRDYLLTLELIDIHTGGVDKESATLRKGYYKSALNKMLKS
jgi:hypothetical protein